ncbi:MAG: hypothetical protein ABEH78_01640 [Haloferacaceae archaeon]
MAEAHDRDPDDVVTVTQDGITVEKRFTTDEFPVPAVKFDIRSEADDPVDVRLIDDIPDSFDMERVGFHPEYEGDAWTAYRDHRVEYERTVDAGEEVTTVYGVRIDDPSTGGRFLGEPSIERVSGGTSAADPEEILGRETTGAVRDALAGEGELSADAEAEAADGTVDLDEPVDMGTGEDLDIDVDEPPADDLDLDVGESEPPADDLELDVHEGEPPAEDLDIDVDGPPAEEDEGAEAGSEATAEEIDLGEPETDAESEAETEAASEAEAEPTPDTGAAAAPEPRSIDSDLTPAVERSTGGGTADETAADVPVEAADETTAAAAGGAGVAGALPGNVVAAVAAEIRDGTADEEDLDVLREALEIDREPEIPRSLEVRIDRLQNRTEDLAAYTDALEAFLDEEGTGQEVLDDLDDRTAALREDLDAVAEETADVSETVADHDERLGDLEGAADDLDEHVASLDDGLADLEDRVDDLETDLDDLAGDAEANVADLRETMEDLEATAADLEDEIEDLQSFRDRMRDAFGS